MTILLDLEQLVELIREREEHDPLTARFAYLSGRIEELARRHGISDIVLELARQSVSRAPIEVTR